MEGELPYLLTILVWTVQITIATYWWPDDIKCMGDISSCSAKNCLPSLRTKKIRLKKKVQKHAYSPPCVMPKRADSPFSFSVKQTQFSPCLLFSPLPFQSWFFSCLISVWNFHFWAMCDFLKTILVFPRNCWPLAFLPYFWKYFLMFRNTVLCMNNEKLFPKYIKK